MRKGILSVGVVLLVASMIVLLFALVGDFKSDSHRTYELSEDQRDGVQSSFSRGDRVAIDFRSDRPVSVYIADPDIGLDFDLAVKVLAAETAHGSVEWKAPDSGEYAIMFRNSGPDPLTVRADIEYRRAIVDVLWMSGTILVAIGLAVMIAGALMPAIEITSSPSELASAYTKVPKVAGPSTVGKGPEGKDTKAAAKPAARRPKVPKRKPANAAVEWETGGAAPSPESRMPMFGAYSFGDRGKAEKEAVGPAQRADGAPPPAPAGEVPDFEEPAEDGPVQVSTLKPSWDHEGNGGATDSAGSGGWDDFGDGSLGESRQDERPPEETKEERPSDWLRKMIESK